MGHRSNMHPTTTRNSSSCRDDQSFDEFMRFYTNFTRRLNLQDAMSDTSEETEDTNEAPEPEIMTSPPRSAIIAEVTDEEVSKIFECPVCFEVILPPIIMCSSGHSVCNKCLPKVNMNGCPKCSGRFTTVRNRWAEEFLENCATLRCRFRENGCGVMASVSDIIGHEENCAFRPLRSEIRIVSSGDGQFNT